MSTSTKFLPSKGSSASGGGAFAFGSSGSSSSSSGGQTEPITRTTLFEKLPPLFQQQILQLQTKLYQETQSMATDIGPEVEKVQKQSKDIEAQLDTVTDQIDSYKDKIKGAKINLESVKRDVEILARRAESSRVLVERNKTAYRTVGDLPSPYFYDMLREFEERMIHYKGVLDGIQKMLDSSSLGRSYSPQSLKNILQSLHQAFMIRAEQIAKVTSDIEDLKAKVQLQLKLQGRSGDILKESTTDNLPRFKPYDLYSMQSLQMKAQQPQQQGGGGGGGFSFGGSSSSSSGGGISFGNSSQSSGNFSFSFGNQSSSSSSGGSGSSGGFSFGGSSASSSSGGSSGFSFGGSSSSSSGGSGGFSFGSSSSSGSSGFSFGGGGGGGGGTTIGGGFSFGSPKK